MVPKYWLMAGCLVIAGLFVAGTVYAKEEATKAVEGAKVVLPDPAAKALTEAFPKATLGKVESCDREGLPLYGVALTEGPAEMWAYVDAAGTIAKIRTPIGLKALPDPVSAAVDKTREGADVRRIDKIDFRADIRKEGGKATLVKLDKARVEFRVTVFKDGKEGHFMLSEAGEIVHPLKWGECKEPGAHPMKPEK